MKKKKRNLEDGELNITSMMDMMTIILVFLLKSFGATEITVEPSDQLKLPIAAVDEEPDVAVSVVIRKDVVFVDDKIVLQNEVFSDPAAPGQQIYGIPKSEKKGTVVPKLYDAFLTAAETAKAIGELAGERDDMKFKGRLLLQIDKDIPFSMLRDVMYNAGQAQFAEFEFIVIKGAG
jgi:biopolymer transport protein ExbD